MAWVDEPEDEPVVTVRCCDTCAGNKLCSGDARLLTGVF